MSRVAVGGIEVVLVRERPYWWDGGVLFGVVPKTLWSRKLGADELNRVPLSFNVCVIETGGHTILIDTGGGDKMDARARERMKLPPEPEPLGATLARHGIDPGRIDIVVNSHLHWDHCGGNTILEGPRVRPAFPGARYYARRGEWEHAHERHPRDRVSYIDSNYDPLVDSGHMCLLDGDAGVAPGVRLVAVRGHNRDMCVVLAESMGQTFCFLSDLVPTAAHVTPTWVSAFDLFPLETIDNKRRLLAQAVRENWICAFSHDTQMDFARIVTDEKTGFAAVDAMPPPGPAKAGWRA